MSGLDHGMLNLPLNSRARGKSIERTIADAKAELAALQREKDRQVKVHRVAARAAEKARVKLTATDCADATHVRDQFGWHKVVRVSSKSVTVATSYSWTERIPLDRILEARTIASP